MNRRSANLGVFLFVVGFVMAIVGYVQTIGMYSNPPDSINTVKLYYSLDTLGTLVALAGVLVLVYQLAKDKQ